jgi:hypothetical protein
MDIYESLGQENSPNVMDKMYLSDGEIQVCSFLFRADILDYTSASLAAPSNVVSNVSSLN